MSDPHAITVRAQTLGEQWETLGADRYRGVVPEGVQFTHNEWGPDTCSFTLRRDPGAIYPDLSTWTPVEVEVAGVISWDGRVKETPVADGDDPTISVQCEGWQYHLDDDVYQKNYVHTRLTDFVDTRSFVTANLQVFVAPLTVTVGDGAIVLMIPQGAAVVTNTVVSTTLDLGPTGSAITVSVDAMSSNNTGLGYQFFIIGHDVPDWSSASSGRQDFLASLDNNSATWGGTNVLHTFTATVGLAHRYISLVGLVQATGTSVADTYFKITAVRAFAASAYQTSGASNLLADVVVKDALTYAPLLSTDTSNIAAGTFVMPEFALGGNHTPREVINAANAYENYEARVLLGQRLAFRPRPSVPIYEIGQWSGANFQDASANSGDEIFNRVLVEGTGPDGAQLAVERTSDVVSTWGSDDFTGTPATNLNARSAVGGAWVTSGEATDFQIAGGGTSVSRSVSTSTTGRYAVLGDATALDVDVSVQASATGMVSSSGSAFMSVIARYTATFRYVRAMFFASNNSLGVVQLDLFGSPNIVAVGRAFAFVAGTVYTIQLSIRAHNGVATMYVYDTATGRLLTSTSLSSPQLITGPLSSGQMGMWDAGSQVSTRVYDNFLATVIYRTTLVDRHGFVRTKILPVDAALTLTSGARIGDLYLASHRTTPFKGGFVAVGQGGVRRVLGGATVHPAHLDVDQLVRCSHRSDPDTGGWGRDGKIASIQYDHDTLTSTVSLDENRAGFEALLARLAVVVGQG